MPRREPTIDQQQHTNQGQQIIDSDLDSVYGVVTVNGKIYTRITTNLVVTNFLLVVAYTDVS